MKEALENAVKTNAEKAAKASSPDEAMKYTQAALNAVNALITLSNIGKYEATITPT